MHDPKCRELAEYFLNGEAATDADAALLAEHIQEAVEDWMDWNIMREHAKPTGEPT